MLRFAVQDHHLVLVICGHLAMHLGDVVANIAGCVFGNRATVAHGFTRCICGHGSPTPLGILCLVSISSRPVSYRVGIESV
ncbi:hypothetical protein GGS26DRAFT_559490 [Hypomontagnella submonticulosa]|nr:hypothetical protein GGS26DRAFT_559490 [Hypomontagnella submonticulosa]